MIKDHTQSFLLYEIMNEIENCITNNGCICSSVVNSLIIRLLYYLLTQIEVFQPLAFIKRIDIFLRRTIICDPFDHGKSTNIC